MVAALCSSSDDTRGWLDLQPGYARMAVNYGIPVADLSLDLDERQLSGRRHLRVND